MFFYKVFFISNLPAMKNTKSQLVFISILALVIIVPVLFWIYSSLNEITKPAILLEIAKATMQLFVIVIIGGAIKFIYDSAVQNKKSDEESKKERSAEKRTELFLSQFERIKYLLHSGDIEKETTAITILIELGHDYPYRWQAIIDELCKYLRNTYGLSKLPDKQRTEVLQYALRSLAMLPRYDTNQHVLNIDISQIRIEFDIDLTSINLKDVTMWGCLFKNTQLSKSSFENADLSGTIFENCGMEWCNFKNALMAYSFMDHKYTTFFKCRLWASNLNEANIIKFNMYNNIDYDLSSLQPFIEKGNVLVR